MSEQNQLAVVLSALGIVISLAALTLTILASRR